MVTFIVDYFSNTSNLLVHTQKIELPRNQLDGLNVNQVLDMIEDKVTYTTLDHTISVSENSRFTFTTRLQRVNNMKQAYDIFG